VYWVLWFVKNGGSDGLNAEEFNDYDYLQEHFFVDVGEFGVRDKNVYSLIGVYRLNLYIPILLSVCFLDTSSITSVNMALWKVQVKMNLFSFEVLRQQGCQRTKLEMNFSTKLKI